MSAIFRTPLGAALLATEVLYRDDFEADALIPALLASVVGYSVFISFYGESTLFAHAPRYPFIPAHLPLYAVLAIAEAALAAFFVRSLDRMKKWSGGWKVPLWARPAIGGLMLGAFTAPILYLTGRWLGRPGQGLGLLGGGYGAVQIAITGADWLPSGWHGVELLLLLCFAKLLASTFTIGTGGSAGDFAPSLVLGGLFGGAFGHAAQILFHDPRIDPGAFVLVGMGTFYGGVAHVPISALVMVCELAGSYDLLVPLMLASGIAFVALRKVSLYHAQLGSQKDSPAHPAHFLDILKGVRVGDVMITDATFVSFEPATSASEMLRRITDASWQDVFPVLDDNKKMLGFVTSDSLRIVAAEPELAPMTVAADAMLPPVSLRPHDTLRAAAEAFVANGVREIPVLDEEGRIAGFIDEADIGKSYLDATVGKEEEPPASRA
jgi:CIC family chloride channel protein